MHFVYIVRCADGTLYTGYARDPRARERAHNGGRGAKYTAGRRPVRLVDQEAFRSPGKARAREYAVKQLTRAHRPDNYILAPLAGSVAVHVAPIW